jgi:hypothetical protein
MSAMRATAAARESLLKICRNLGEYALGTNLKNYNLSLLASLGRRRFGLRPRALRAYLPRAA